MNWSPLLLSAALLVGCAKPAPENLVSKVLFTVNGSYDASADSRTREGKGMRRVQWLKHPPLDAAQVTIDYESDARSLGWIMTIDEPKFDAKKLAGPSALSLQTPQGPALLITNGELKDTLLLTGDHTLRLLSHGYAARHTPELLPSFEDHEKPKAP